MGPRKKNCFKTNENEQMFPTFLWFSPKSKNSPPKHSAIFFREVQVTRDISILKLDMG